MQPNGAQADSHFVSQCLIWPNSPQEMASKLQKSKNNSHGTTFFQTNAAAFHIWNSAFSFFLKPRYGDVPRILPFRHIHLLLCLVSHRLFILAFISAITAVPIWSLRAKWKPVVSLRCRLKVSACNGSWHRLSSPFWRSTIGSTRHRKLWKDLS